MHPFSFFDVGAFSFFGSASEQLSYLPVWSS